MSPSKKRLTDGYRFRGFTPDPIVHGVFGDPKAVVITLKRREKKLVVRYAVMPGRRSTTGKSTGPEIYPRVTVVCLWRLNAVASSVRGARK
jgi:hypothetical protein